jgi:hypothetical protein
MTFGSFRVAGVKPTTGNPSVGVVAAQPQKTLGESVAVQEVTIRPAMTETVASSEAMGNAPASQPLSVVTETAGTPSLKSTEQLLASSSATVKAAGQALAQLVGLGDTGNIQSGNTRVAMVEPLTQVATPRDNRRTRLLAYSVAFDPHAADSSDAVRSRERITHRISDEAIYDSITRLGLSGNRVSIKF